MKQIYKITYHPTGKIYIGKDSIGSYRYYGSPDMDTVNADFEKLPSEIRKNYTIQKEILWESPDCEESELSKKEVEYIRKYKSNVTIQHFSKQLKNASFYPRSCSDCL